MTPRPAVAGRVKAKGRNPTYQTCQHQTYHHPAANQAWGASKFLRFRSQSPPESLCQSPRMGRRMCGQRSRESEVVSDVATSAEVGAPQWQRSTRKLRAWMRHRLRGWTPAMGYLYIAMALAYAVDDFDAGAIVALVLGVPVTWVCSLWVVPRSEDAYALAMSRVLNKWGTDAAAMLKRRAIETREIATRSLDSLAASLRAPLNDRLNAVLDGETETSIPTRETICGRAMAAHELSGLLKLMLEDESVDNEHAAAVRTALVKLVDARRETQREFLDALQREKACVVKIRPPIRSRALHEAYVQLAGQYSDAVVACHAAIEGDREDEMQQSAEVMCDLWQARQDYRQDLATRLRERYDGST